MATAQFPFPLTAALERELTRRIALEYDTSNELHFARRLVRPILTLSDSSSRLGLWRSTTRRLEVSRVLVLERAWTEVVEVLKHEMAHQYVDEVLRVRGEPPHGPAFARVCAERGIDARAEGIPLAAAGADATSRVLERVQKLLALASSNEEHEASAAMRKAHELMLRHNLSSVEGAEARYEARHLGDASSRRSAVEREVVALLSKYFFVQVIEIPTYVARTGKRGWVFEVCGTRANVALAEHAFVFLLETADRLWRRLRRERSIAASERLPYQCGVIRGFGEKLESEREVLRGTGLVWVGDAGLERYYHARHPRISRATQYQRLGAAHELGREAGREVVLHRPVGPGGASSREPPRRLRSGS